MTESLLPTSGFDQKKYDQGLDEKKAANEKFKAGDFVGALRGYHRTLLYWLGLNSNPMGGTAQNEADIDSEDKVSDLDKQISLIYSNMAACQVRLHKADRAVECAESALKRNKFNEKAKFRLVQGLIEGGSLLKAMSLLDELEKGKPNDPAFKNERAKIAVKEKEAAAKQRKELGG
ncbi:hypothetical protein FBU59_006699, partial [Linderina macrospora]